MNDDGFVTRVLRMSLAASVFVAWCLLALGRVYEAESFGIGAGIALVMMWTVRLAVMRATTPGRFRGKWFAVTLAVLKYVAAGYVILRFVRWPHAQVMFFIAGVAVTQVVLAMKAVGQMMAQRRGAGTERWSTLRLPPARREIGDDKAR